jgi:hypothetical protein
MSQITNPESILKKAFAEAWLHNPTNAFAAALEITGNDPAAALEISSAWSHDPEVKRLKAELIEQHGQEAFLPTKHEILHDIYSRARTCPHNDDYVKMMRLAADMRGQIEKPGITINNNNSVTTNKVMQVPVFINNTGYPVDDDEWEQRLIENQEALTRQ